MINENLKLSGQLNIVLKDKAGNIKDQREVKNLVVKHRVGVYSVAYDRIRLKALCLIWQLVPAPLLATGAQTDLVSMLGAREAIDSSNIIGSNNEKVVYVSNFEAGDGTGAVTEAGIFNAATIWGHVMPNSFCCREQSG